MKECPNCRLFSPDEALLCECGYSFVAGSADEAPRPLASQGRRLAAQIVDGLVAIVFLFSAIPLADLNEKLTPVAPLLFFAYYFFSDGFPNGQSLGKRLLGIRVVVDETGAPCSIWRSFVRNVTQILGIFDWIWIFGDKRKRAGDILAHTRVVVA